MGYIPGMDSLANLTNIDTNQSEDNRLMSYADNNGILAPQHLADCMRISRTEAKIILQQASNRGVCSLLPNGRYKFNY